MYIEIRKLRGVQKFVETSVVRRNSIDRIMVSANSVTPPKENCNVNYLNCLEKVILKIREEYLVTMNCL